MNHITKLNCTPVIKEMDARTKTAYPTLFCDSLDDEAVLAKIAAALIDARQEWSREAVYAATTETLLFNGPAYTFTDQFPVHGTPAQIRKHVASVLTGVRYEGAPDPYQHTYNKNGVETYCDTFDKLFTARNVQKINSSAMEPGARYLQDHATTGLSNLLGVEAANLGFLVSPPTMETMMHVDETSSLVQSFHGNTTNKLWILGMGLSTDGVRLVNEELDKDPADRSLCTILDLSPRIKIVIQTPNSTVFNPYHIPHAVLTYGGPARFVGIGQQLVPRAGLDVGAWSSHLKTGIRDTLFALGDVAEMLVRCTADDDPTVHDAVIDLLMHRRIDGGAKKCKDPTAEAGSQRSHTKSAVAVDDPRAQSSRRKRTYHRWIPDAIVRLFMIAYTDPTRIRGDWGVVRRLEHFHQLLRRTSPSEMHAHMVQHGVAADDESPIPPADDTVVALLLAYYDPTRLRNTWSSTRLLEHFQTVEHDHPSEVEQLLSRLPATRGAPRWRR